MADPRSIDPAHVERDEDDLAAEHTSSTPLEDAEERRDQNLRGGGDPDQAALDAMPEGNAETGDQVASGEAHEDRNR